MSEHIEGSDYFNQKDQEAIKHSPSSKYNFTDNEAKPSYNPTEPYECVQNINEKIQTSESFSAPIEGNDTGNQKDNEFIKSAPIIITNDSNSTSKPSYNPTEPD